MASQNVVDTLLNWLKMKRRQNLTFSKFSVTDIDEKSERQEVVVRSLSELFTYSMFNDAIINESISRLGQKKTQDILISPHLPTIRNIQLGDFGEVIVSAILRFFEGYDIPIQKLRFTFAANQSPPSTDTVAFKSSDGRLQEVCFVESKLRTENDSSAAVKAYNQLELDLNAKIPQMVLFIATRLIETGDPLGNIFMDYMLAREDLTEIEKLKIGLVWETTNWSETVLTRLEESVDEPIRETEITLVRLSGLEGLVNQVFHHMGFQRTGGGE